MNDLSELENDLKALRPAQPSPVLFERIEEAMAEDRKASTAANDQPFSKSLWRRLMENPFRFGIGLAAAVAAIVLLVARITTDQTRNDHKEIAQVVQTSPALPAFSDRSGVDGSTSSNKFVPSGATQVVYNTRNEGLQFADGSKQPLRRLRYQTQQTWQWRNPSTGASLRVSYPSEEVVLIPVSGQ